MATKIPATVITGFLGSGKTSMIRHLIEHAGGKRIALIINEFGDLGVDRDTLAACGIEGCDEEDIVELTNGCLCCTVADDFLPSIEALLRRDPPPDHIVIETSGLALPKPLLKAFNWPAVKTRVSVDGVIAVIDGPATAAGFFADDPQAVEAARQSDDSLDHDNPLAELFADQVQCADMIVVNKVDQMDQPALAAAKAAIQDHRRGAARVLEARYGALPPAVLLGLGASAETDLDSRPSHHDGEDDHDHDDFDSIVVEPGPIEEPVAYRRHLAEVARRYGILRLKGFLSVPGRPRRYALQGVGERLDGYYDRPWAASETPTSRLVIIAEHDADWAGLRQAVTGETLAA